MYRVLIVDDEAPFLHSLMGFNWEASNCRCVGQAANGQEAIDKCTVLAPHIVITDIDMPVMDGLSLLAVLNQQFPEIQVILLTVHQDFRYAQKAITHNACDYLIKDMNYGNTLHAVLKKACAFFEQRTDRANPTANLLRRSGRMLVLESEEALAAYQEEITHFLGRYAQTLVTANLHQPNLSLEQLIAQLDMLLNSLDQTVGIILRSESCFELVINQKLASASAWLHHALAESWFCHHAPNANFALAPCGQTIAQYTHAHQQNASMLERGFYSPQPSIVVSTHTPFNPLPASIADDWVRMFDSPTGAALCDHSNWERIEAQAQSGFYIPDAVRKTVDRILCKYELYYAAAADKQLHAAILNAPNIKALSTFLMQAARITRERQNNYSFFIVRAKEYIAASLGQPSLQLVDVAEHVGISPGYLSKKLKEETGQTFQELLICMRMEYASQLLRKSDKRVYEIAELIGYENARSFTTAFSNYYGVSPKKYVQEG